MASRTIYKKRAQTTLPKKELPKKGRIRIVLILLVLVLVGLRFINRKPQNNKPTKPKTKAAVDTTKVVADTTKVNTTSKSSQSVQVEKKPEVKREKAPKGLFTSIDDVKLSLQENPASLQRESDTVIWKKRKVIRHFSLDSSLVRLGEVYFRQYTPLYGAVVILQPRTGRVIALNSYINPSNDTTAESSLQGALFATAQVPAASLAKLITATTAIEVAKYSPRSLIEFSGDRHTLYSKQLKRKLDKKQSLMLREAFAYSVNPVFGRLGLFTLGSNNIYNYAQKYGFNTAIPFELPIEKSHFKKPEGDVELAELASGFNGSTKVSPMLGALMAGAVSNRGVMIAPTLVDSIVDLASDETVYKRKAVLWRRAASEQTASQLIPLMEDVVKYGTATTAFKNIKNSPRFNDFLYGGKTGSKEMKGYGNADWFIGFLKDSTDASKDLACGIFLIHPPKWKVKSAYIGAEMMRNHVMDLQKQEALELKSHEEKKRKSIDG